MASSDETKQQLVAQMARSRTELAGNTGAVRYTLNFPRRFGLVFEKYSFGWVSIAALVGWVLARLPARKQKIYIHDRTQKRVAKEAGASVLAGVLWSGIWSIARPIITAYLRQRLARADSRTESKA
jgi:hypothetical protein